MGIQNGFMCPNDVRALENMDLIPEELGGNLYMVNGNMLPLVSAGAFYATSTSVPDETPAESEEP